MANGNGNGNEERGNSGETSGDEISGLGGIEDFARIAAENYQSRIETGENYSRDTERRNPGGNKGNQTGNKGTKRGIKRAKRDSSSGNSSAGTSKASSGGASTENETLDTEVGATIEPEIVDPDVVESAPFRLVNPGKAKDESKKDNSSNYRTSAKDKGKLLQHLFRGIAAVFGDQWELENSEAAEMATAFERLPLSKENVVLKIMARNEPYINFAIVAASILGPRIKITSELRRAEKEKQAAQQEAQQQSEEGKVYEFNSSSQSAGDNTYASPNKDRFNRRYN